MKTLTSVAAALVLIAGLSTDLDARGGGNFVSVFEHPKFGTCWIDLHPVKKDLDDAREEVEAALADPGKNGDFRGVRPDQVARAHYKQCGVKEAPPPKG